MAEGAVACQHLCGKIRWRGIKDPPEELTLEPLLPSREPTAIRLRRLLLDVVAADLPRQDPTSDRSHDGIPTCPDVRNEPAFFLVLGDEPLREQARRMPRRRTVSERADRRLDELRGTESRVEAQGAVKAVMDTDASNPGVRTIGPGRTQQSSRQETHPPTNTPASVSSSAVTLLALAPPSISRPCTSAAGPTTRAASSSCCCCCASAVSFRVASQSHK